ncbi:unnamed protein product [Phytophthora fragariaefolia]|uniref:Unnamed protein product n=1 Tax=Phytophthora fragariaefolia TaxID=1490495 RepID=A0A9W6Y650_9STRA|nr:unnamed protein product [Phytophthora fragariaefolia]
MKSGRIEMEGGPTPQTGSGGRLSSISEMSVSFDESAGGISEAKDEEVNEYEDSEADGYVFGDDLDASDEARVSAGRCGAPRPITRNLAGEFDEVAKPEPARDEAVIRKLPGNRPPMNSSTCYNRYLHVDMWRHRTWRLMRLLYPAGRLSIKCECI